MEAVERENRATWNHRHVIHTSIILGITGVILLLFLVERLKTTKKKIDPDINSNSHFFMGSELN